MATWAEIEEEAPELAATARKLFDAHAHKTIATLRRDGSPRISGIECVFEDGELWFGSMPGGVKALDLRRDPRFALHSASSDPAIRPWPGDAKIAGLAVEVEHEGDSHKFRADVTEVSVVQHGTPLDHLVITSWHPGRGVHSFKRY